MKASAEIGQFVVLYLGSCALEVWIFKFGFWTLNFVFLNLDFGYFWILDVGFWSLGMFGPWIWKFGLCNLDFRCGISFPVILNSIVRVDVDGCGWVFPGAKPSIKWVVPTP